MPCAYISLYGSIFRFLFLLAGSSSSTLLCNVCHSVQICPLCKLSAGSGYSYPGVIKSIFLNGVMLLMYMTWRNILQSQIYEFLL